MRKLFIIIFFISGFTFAQIIDSYSESNRSIGYDFLLNHNTTRVGQSFTSNGTNTLRSAKFYLLKVGAPSGSVYAKLYTHSGTYGTSSIGTGNALATSDPVSTSLISTSMELITFNFSTSYTLNSGVYILSVEYANGNPSDYIGVGQDASESSHSGNMSYYGADWNVLPYNDCIFYASTQAVGTTFIPIITFIE
jgi:hypothetical protein